jgi:hypothetical protein
MLAQRAPAPLLVLLHRVEREAEAPGKLRLGQPQLRPQGTNLVRRRRRIYRLRTRQLLVGPRIPVLDRLRLDLICAGLRPPGQFGQQLRLVDVSPGASHDRHPVPSCSHSAG